MEHALDIGDFKPVEQQPPAKKSRKPGMQLNVYHVLIMIIIIYTHTQAQRQSVSNSAPTRDKRGLYIQSIQ